MVPPTYKQRSSALRSVVQTPVGGDAKYTKNARRNGEKQAGVTLCYNNRGYECPSPKDEQSRENRHSGEAPVQLCPRQQHEADGHKENTKRSNTGLDPDKYAAVHKKNIVVSNQDIGDHQPVAFTIDLGLITLEKQKRVLWDFPRAKWKNMKKELQCKSYKEIRGKTVEHTVRNIAKEIHKAMQRNIPFKSSRPVDKAHPWIDAKCEELQGKAHLGDKHAEKELEKRLTQNYEKYAEKNPKIK